MTEVVGVVVCILAMMLVVHVIHERRIRGLEDQLKAIKEWCYDRFGELP